jgi:hypothetical protein
MFLSAISSIQWYQADAALNQLTSAIEAEKSARQTAVAARQDLEQVSYSMRIQLAALYLSQGNHSLAFVWLQSIATDSSPFEMSASAQPDPEVLVDGSSVDRRDWEWHYLYTRSHPPLPIGTEYDSLTSRGMYTHPAWNPDGRFLLLPLTIIRRRQKQFCELSKYRIARLMVWK